MRMGDFKKFGYLGLASVALLMQGCNPESRGFSLPKGDAEQGRATFVLMQCNVMIAMQ